MDAATIRVRRPTPPGENLPRHCQFQRVTEARLNSRGTCSASAYADVGDDEGCWGGRASGIVQPTVLMDPRLAFARLRAS